MITSKCGTCGKTWRKPRSSLNSLFCLFAWTPENVALFYDILLIVQSALMRYAQQQAIDYGPTWDPPDLIFWKSVEKIMEYAPNFDCEKSLYGLWKMAIHNLTLDSAKKAASRRTTSSSELLISINADAGERAAFDFRDDDPLLNPAELLLRNEQINMLRDGVSRLPIDCRDVIIRWMALDKPTFTQISRDLSKPYSTVRRLFFKATRILAKELR
jgi:DNA-directed RNA polymerase specialized sigma24 family protein